MGIIVALIASEILLRLAGTIYYKVRVASECNRIDQNRLLALREETRQIKILCLGDSWTFGIGAPAGYSYPAQLQAISDKESPGKYLIYNCGRPGWTSTRLLEYLPRFLKEYNPNIVVIQIGQNDIGFSFPSEIILLRIIASKSHLYKLLKLSLYGITERISLLKNQSKNIEEINPESIKFVAMGETALSESDSNSAKNYFQKAIDTDQKNEMAYLRLGQVYQLLKEYDKAIEIFEKIIIINPYATVREDLFRLLFSMYQADIKELQGKIETLIRKIPSDSKFMNPGTLFVLNNKIIAKNLENNINKIIDLVRLCKMIPVFQEYFDKDFLSNQIIRQIAKKRNVILINNEKELEQIKNIENYVNVDGHPKQEGYFIMAKNTFEVIKNLPSEGVVTYEK